MGTPDPDPQIDPLYIESHTADKIKSDGRVHEPSTMRAIAEALAKNLAAVEKAGGNEFVLADIRLGAAPFGEWNDAKAFGATAGESAGQKLGRVYSEFVEAYRNVIAAVEASAGNHAEADTRNEGA